MSHNERLADLVRAAGVVVRERRTGRGPSSYRNEPAPEEEAPAAIAAAEKGRSRECIAAVIATLAESIARDSLVD